MAQTSYDLDTEEGVKEYLRNLGIEYRFSCYSENKADGCHLLGDYLEAVDKDFEKAQKVYKDNCDKNLFGHSCCKFGTYLVLGKGGLKKDIQQAYKYFRTGCENSSGIGCYHAGLLISSGKIGGKKDKVTAAHLFEKGCELDNPQSCYHISSLLLQGGDVPRDLKGAFKFALKACEMDNPYACANVSMMYKKGDGVKVDNALSEKYRKIAGDLQEAHKKEQRRLKLNE